MSKEYRSLRNEKSDEGRRIWMEIDAAAARAPRWMKERVENALDESVRRSARSEGVVSRDRST